MKRKLEISELIFKILSYTLLTVFALCCLYPFVYALAASVSGRSAVEYGSVVEILDAAARQNIKMVLATQAGGQKK